MALEQAKIIEYTRRLMASRMRIIANHGFYGLLLTHLIFTIDQSCETAATDGERLYFGPEFLDNISDSELDFILMHEVLHVVLKHCFRDGDRNPVLFNIATDIVVNSNIMESWGGDRRKITLQAYGESMHITPLGDEGYLYNAEEVYEMIIDKMKQNGINPSNSQGDGSASQKNGTSHSGKDGEGDKDNSSNGDGKSKGKDKSKDGKSKDGKGSDGDGDGDDKNGKGNGKDIAEKLRGNGLFDDHSRWDSLSDEEKQRIQDQWDKRIEDAVNVISITDPSNQCGSVPMCVQRILKERKSAQTDWRSILTSFIQDEINDYSFSPPDRRFSDSPFFLPDYNEKDETVKDILFMIDTSGSMSDDMISQAFNEIRGAIEQFNGRLVGWLGFFDAQVVTPIEFSSIDELEIIKAYGGGGTSFRVIFDYVKKEMEFNPPSSIVILTDGYAPFPKEDVAMKIPVLWIINNEDVTPPWGKVCRIKVE
ncbi:MAG: hypothetical protein J6B29_05495 [Clostridia bacterium]|nr:hypothetical protein [Clostridia bacterium]